MLAHMSVAMRKHIALWSCVLAHAVVLHVALWSRFLWTHRHRHTCAHDVDLRDVLHAAGLAAALPTRRFPLMTIFEIIRAYQEDSAAPQVDLLAQSQCAQDVQTLAE